MRPLRPARRLGRVRLASGPMMPNMQRSKIKRIVAAQRRRRRSRQADVGIYLAALERWAHDGRRRWARPIRECALVVAQLRWITFTRSRQDPRISTSQEIYVNATPARPPELGAGARMAAILRGPPGCAKSSNGAALSSLPKAVGSDQAAGKPRLLIKPDPLDPRLSRARHRRRPDRRQGRDRGGGRARADDLPQFAGDRHRDDDRRLSGISRDRLPAQPAHAAAERHRSPRSITTRTSRSSWCAPSARPTTRRS